MLFPRDAHEQKQKKRIALFSGFCILAMIYSFCLRPPDLIRNIGYSQVVYDRNGKVLRITLTGDDKYRVKATLAEFSPGLVRLVLFKEDRWFYLHKGFNPVALFGAAWHTLVMRDSRYGASTISMQLARMLYKLDTKSAGGKLLQVARAIQLELYYSKETILEAYLNLVPCGKNVEGYGAASLVYLEKEVSGIAIEDAFLLSVIPQSPEKRTPTPDGENVPLVSARNRLIESWLVSHPGDSALKSQIGLPVRLSEHLPFFAPQFVNAVIDNHRNRPHLRTTLDLPIQELIEQQAKSYVTRKRDIGIENACVLLLDYQTMEEKAYVGSVDFFNEGIEGQVNGVLAKRSPGSTVKPFIYALALDQGIIHPMTMLKDSPTSFGSYHPDNFDGEFEGPIKARDALVKSRNVPAVYLASKLAKPDLYEFLVSSGVADFLPKEHYGLSLVLGGAELSMSELVRLYALLANGGTLKEIRDLKSERSPRHDGRRLLSPEACFLTLDMLGGNPRPDLLGNNEWASGNAPVYWKTGTSTAFKDAWTIGIFDNYVLGVWIGNFSGQGNPAFTSLKAAAPLFFDIVDSIRANRLSVQKQFGAYWEIPDTVKKIQVCSVSGKIPNLNCPSVVSTWFIPGKSPIGVCDIHREIAIDPRTGYRVPMTGSGKSRKAVYEFWPSDLLALFEQAGIPRKVPPPFDPRDSLASRETKGRRPEITSPQPENKYIIRLGDTATQGVPFTAIADADSKEVFWFVDDAFAGKAAAGSAFFWKASAGIYKVRVVDEQGREDECRLTVLLSR
jgi:penicillin-binding protein 1C